MAEPFVSKPSAGERLAFMGQVSLVRARGDQTGGLMTVIETRTPAGNGPPLHLHEREDEMFLVLEGEYTFTLGEEKFNAAAGTFVFGPRGVAHGYVAIVPSRHLAMLSPPGFERFLHDAGEAAIAGPTAIAAVAERYGMRQLESREGS